MPDAGPHFPNLPPEARARLEARGIDPEASCTAMLAAIRSGDFMLDVLPIVLPAHGRLERYAAGCRCAACRFAKSEDHRRSRGAPPRLRGSHFLTPPPPAR